MALSRRAPAMTMDHRDTTVLVVDDERNIRLALKGVLNPFYSVATAGSGEEALTLASESDFDLVLLDIHMPGIDGLEVLESIKRQCPHIAVIILTGYASVDNAVHALRHGALNYLQKPASSEEVLDSVEEALTHANRERKRSAVLRKAQQLLSEGLRQLGEVTPEQIDLVTEADAGERTPDDARDDDRFVKRGPLVIDVYRRKATLNGDLLDLTAGEYDLLLCLVQEAPRVLGPQELVERTRGYECSLAEAREIIRWQVYLLRQKVEADPSAPQLVLNVRGRGYMWAGV